MYGTLSLIHVSRRDLVHYQCIYYYYYCRILLQLYLENTRVKMLGKALFLLQLRLENAMVKTVGNAL